MSGGTEVASGELWPKISQEAPLICFYSVFQCAFHERHNLCLLSGIIFEGGGLGSSVIQFIWDPLEENQAFLL